MRQARTHVHPEPLEISDWGAAVDAFLREKRRANLSAATLDVYAMCLRGPRAQVWRQELGIATTADLTSDSLRQLELDLAQAGLSPSTVHIYHRTLKTFARWCTDEGYDVGAKVLALPGPRLPDEEPATFTADEEQRLLAAARYPRDRFLLEFLFHTGLRLAEVCAVTIDDVMTGPDSTWLRVRQGKGRKDRTVPLDTPSYRLSRKLNAYVRDVRPRTTGNRALFVTLSRDSRGEHARLDTSAVTTILRRLGAETGIHVHAHKFRHTFATRAVAAGVDVLALQRVLGHTSLSMTSRYAHHSAASLVDAWMARRD